jgi:hypothetical protein
MPYYFINYSKGELCTFNENQSILTALEGALNKNKGWNTLNDIRVKSAESNIIWRDYVVDLGFKDLEMGEECYLEDEDEPPAIEDDMFLPARA